ncbi:hypothetical protein PP353_gp73 [Arthrobacter phage Kumotta]|uniref:Uncharacterized protein n=2 Tax=Kumottavirus TaxID=3044749 RepID=A0A4Y6EM79_9CAUD|nr:hypothetical protein PP353_gp73 [Arthrobacter phage Kumotta]YP_010649551.1 hypothetical protein PP356_gp69 [Arthrobacter phage MargaretKali]AXH44449.1 hypothetical protein SEA_MARGARETKALI_69 [Arthrobacter phage MargaretKali]QDF19582.1 hypothetical protein SEA_KUMOTTA_73 [Arthrobacter phage Kumotta]
MSNPDFVDARPINGHLIHAVRNQPEFFHRTAPFIVVTYARALCGVGRGGMRIMLDTKGLERPYTGIDGCDSCHVKVNKLRKEAT